VEALKVLGQSAPTATVLTAMYTVPASTQATVSTLFICNRSSSNAKFRISVAIAGAADTAAQYLYYDVVLLKNTTATATVGLTLGTGDVIRVYTDTADVVFSAFGVEVV